MLVSLATLNAGVPLVLEEDCILSVHCTMVLIDLAHFDAADMR
jgi:hypothetical protein